MCIRDSAVSTRRKWFFTILAWSIAFVIFFPILWTILTSFKSEGDAILIPPKFLFFDWTTENYGVVQERSDYIKFAMNSIILALGSTAFALIIAIPSAWGMAMPQAEGMAMMSAKAVEPSARMIEFIANLM